MSQGFELVESQHGTDVVVTGAWSPRAEAELRSRHADGLVLNYAKGFRERSLDFLLGLPIRRLNILARTIKDLRPIYSLSETLEDLQLQTAPTEVRLDLLPRVLSLGATWTQIAATISTLPHLRSLLALSYSEPSLDPLASNRELRTIRMKDRPAVTTLEGIHQFGILEHLDLSLAPLGSLSPLVEAAPTLQKLEFESCKNIHDLRGIERLGALTSINMGDCGELESLHPISGLEHLEEVYLWGSTVVSDGDLTPLASLPKLATLRMTSRKSYRPSVAEIKAKIGDL